MKLKISKTTEKRIKEFKDKEWKEPHLKRFGRPIKWTKKPLVFKATEKGKVVGTIIAHYQGEMVYIKNIIVAKEKRHCGIGRKLIKKVEMEAKRLGSHKIFLYTGKKWDTNKFYKKLGYKIAAVLPRHYFKTDYVIYSKFL